MRLYALHTDKAGEDDISPCKPACLSGSGCAARARAKTASGIKRSTGDAVMGYGAPVTGFDPCHVCEFQRFNEFHHAPNLGRLLEQPPSMIGIAMLVAVITAPCEFGLTSERPDFKATVSMLADRSIVVHVADPMNPELPDQIFVPGTADYDIAIKNAGGLVPGETKNVPQVVGRIYMNADSSFVVGGNDVVGSLVVRPGDERYARILKLVGPLKPGEWVALTAPPRG